MNLLDIETTMFLREPAEFATVIISAVGMFIGVYGFFFFRYSKTKIAKKMSLEYLTDAGVFLVTLIMGVGLFLDMPLVVHYDIIVRPLILGLNVWAAYRLLKHFRQVN